MKFVLTLNIEEDVSRKDIALALRRTAATLERTTDAIEEGDSAPVRDPRGTHVGDWEIAP